MNKTLALLAALGVVVAAPAFAYEAPKADASKPAAVAEDKAADEAKDAAAPSAGAVKKEEKAGEKSLKKEEEKKEEKKN